MADRSLTRRLFIAKAAPLVAAATVPAAALAGDFCPILGKSLAANPAEPDEHMRAIVQHFTAQAPDSAGRITIQIGGTPQAFGYVAHAYISSWMPDARLRGGGFHREEAIELARVSATDLIGS